MSAQKKETQPGWIALAVVTQPHGVSGRVKIKSLADPAESIKKHCKLSEPSGREVCFRFTGEAQGQYIIEIEGLSDRNEAELWRGRQLGMTRAELPELKKENQFYAVDLIGACVETDDGRAFGTVHDFQNYGAGDIIEITRPNGVRELFSFTKTNFPTVDLTARRLVINPPEIIGSRAEEESGDA